MKQPEAWERQPGETSKAYAAFSIYLRLGRNRTLEQVSEGLGHRGPATVRAWSAANGWKNRVREWDAHLEVQVAQKMEEEITEARVRHARIARAGQEIYEAVLKKAVARISQGTIEIDDLDIDTLSQVLQRLSKPFKSLVEVERLASGMHTQKIDVAGTLSLEERRFLDLALHDDRGRQLLVELCELAEPPGE